MSNSPLNSPSGRCVVLMYHSVGSCPSGPANPRIAGVATSDEERATAAVAGSAPISFDQFKHQVHAARAAGWTFAHVRDLFTPSTSDRLFITGDDGTSDWATQVLPWCERESVPTHTAIVTGPWRTRAMYPTAHIIQLLLVSRDESELGAMRSRINEQLTADQREYIDHIYAYETDDNRRTIKGACNIVFGDARARRLLGALTAEEQGLLESRFASADAYRGMKSASVGVHTVTHRAIDRDVEAYLEDEVDACHVDVRKAELTPSDVFTLPMAPRYGTDLDNLVAGLRAAGYRGMFHGSGEWDGSSFIIPRIDTRVMETTLGLPEFRAELAHVA